MRGQFGTDRRAADDANAKGQRCDTSPDWSAILDLL
jgi:hypothetical protein